MGPMPDLTPIFYLAMFGLACAAVLVIGGGGYAIWWAINHIQIV